MRYSEMLWTCELQIKKKGLFLCTLGLSDGRDGEASAKNLKNWLHLKNQYSSVKNLIKTRNFRRTEGIFIMHGD